MTRASEQKAFFNSQGAVGICSAFTRELEKGGKLEERGEATIDTFVAAVNKKLAARTIDIEDLEYAKRCVEDTSLIGPNIKYILAQLIKAVEATKHD